MTILHANNCPGCDESTAFICDVCGRECAACLGSDDDKPNTCDGCYELPNDVANRLKEISNHAKTAFTPRSELVCGKLTGFLIAFEGIDGSGKSTQVEPVAARVRELGYDVVTTREPTDGQCGRQIREANGLSSERERELFELDRREHVREVIAPALSAGKVVITDRYYYSTAAYQGARGQDWAQIIRENERFAPKPDLLFVFDLPVNVALDRVASRGKQDRFENAEYLAEVSYIYRQISRHYDHSRLLPAEMSPQWLTKIIVALAYGRLLPSTAEQRLRDAERLARNAR